MGSKSCNWGGSLVFESFGVSFSLQPAWELMIELVVVFDIQNQKRLKGKNLLSIGTI